MSKYLRHQPVISTNSNTDEKEDHWFKQFEKTLQKGAVQSRNTDTSLFDQINSIMNGSKSKHPSVSAAVDEMKERSGFSAHIDNISKISNKEVDAKKTASDNNQVIDKKVDLTPIVIKKCPQVKSTLENYIHDTRGNLPVPAIVEKIKSIHKNDVSESKDWDDDKLLLMVSNLNLKAKKDNPEHYVNTSHLGTRDPSNDSDSNSAENDAFHSLMPAKM